jgi:hemerythrin-like metal-binding protein
MAQIPKHLQTGLSIVDHEHQTLLNLLERTKAVCPIRPTGNCHTCPPEQARQCFVAFERVLNETINYMLDHFAREERMMEKIVPKEHVDRHQAAHADIANAVMRMSTYVDSDKTATTSQELADLFERWLVGHITDYDLELSRLIAERDGAEKH